MESDEDDPGGTGTVGAAGLFGAAVAVVSTKSGPGKETATPHLAQKRLPEGISLEQDGQRIIRDDNSRLSFDDCQLPGVAPFRWGVAIFCGIRRQGGPTTGSTGRFLVGLPSS